jgi:uncharacterized protein
MTIKKTQKYSLITGAGSGLGFEFARICAANNYSLILIDKDKEKLESSSGYLRSTFNVTVTAFEKDLSQNNCALDIFNSVNEKGIIPEILINNAGFGYFGLFAENNWQKQEELIRLLVLTTTHLTKLFLPGMILNKYGRILNVSSLAAFQPGPLMSVYHASKSFILSFSQALSNELNGSGVTVTVLCPGMMATGFQKANNNESPNLKWSVGSAEKVARIGYKGMMKGKVVIIPGIMNQIGANLPRFLPRTFTTSIVRNIQEKNRRKLTNNKS